MGMVVAKLVRLTRKNENGEFEKDGEGKITVRKRVVIDQSSVDEFKGNYKTSGLIYEVDKEETAKRNKTVEAEVAAARKAEKEAQNPQSVAPVVPATQSTVPEIPAKDVKDPGAKAIQEADTSKKATDTAAKDVKDNATNL